MYNPRNLQKLGQDNVDLKIQEKIAFDRINSSFIREIPLTIINRKKFKVKIFVSKNSHPLAFWTCYFNFKPQI